MYRFTVMEGHGVKININPLLKILFFILITSRLQYTEQQSIRKRIHVYISAGTRNIYMYTLLVDNARSRKITFYLSYFQLA